MTPSTRWSLATASLAISISAQARLSTSTYHWTAGGDGTSLFGETNWTENADGSGANIPAINAGQSLDADLVIASGVVGGGGANGILTFANSCLLMSGGTLNFANGFGITGGDLSIEGNASLNASFIENTTLSVSGAATLNLHSISSSQVELSAGTIILTSATPLVESSINFSSDSSAKVYLPALSPSEVARSLLGSFFINSTASMATGPSKNVSILPDGDAGSVVTHFAGPNDSDEDGIDDAWEVSYFGDLTRDGSGDFDNDGLSDLAEANLNTAPNDPDTDSDQLSDGEEVTRHETDPSNSDSDGDSNPDGFEIEKGTDPNDKNSRTNQPNILFILADDLGYGDLGILFQNSKSGKKHKTPFFDQMASEGLILDRHYCPAPVCAPSRASLLTGLHQGHANIRDNQFDKELEDNHTLPTTLRAAGYSTHIIGKYGLQGGGGSPAAWPAYPTKRGFDSFFGYVRHGDGHTHYPFHNTASRGAKELYDQERMIRDDLDKCFTPDLFTARAKKLIADEVNDGDDQPFFLYLAYDTPHAALQLPTVSYPGENNSHDLDDSGLGLNGGVQWLGTPGSMINTATGAIDSYRHPDYTTAVSNSWTDVEERFATLVRRMDDNLGDLRKTLVDLGIAEDTLIVFTSDNGPHQEDYLSNAQTNDGSSYRPDSFSSYGPFDGIKRDCWEGGIREPSLVCWPATIPAGTVTTQHSQFQDWLPTFCELAGVPAPARTDGVSLVPTLLSPANPSGQKPPSTYIEYTNNGNTPNYTDGNHGGRSRSQAQVIFLDGYKGIRVNTNGPDDDFEIYETITDPAESTDLFTSPSTEQASYFAELQQRMKDRVLQLRLPDSSAPRPYDNAAIPPPTFMPTLTSGLSYQTYSGVWPWVPEFTDLTPSASGLLPNGLSLEYLPASTSDKGLYFHGYLKVPASGNWTFELTTDSGAILKIHDILTIDDDYDHDSSPVSQNLNLAAGYHPIRIYYKNSFSRTPALSLRWSGPGTTEQEIPASAFFSEGIPDPVPTVTDDQVSTSATDTSVNPLTFSPLGNDSDDGLPSELSIVSFTQPLGGLVTQNEDELTLTPEVGFFGPTTFDYTITDGENSATGTITVTVVYDAPDVWLPFQECDGPTTFRANGEVAGILSSSVVRSSGRDGFGLTFNGSDSDFTLTGLTKLPTGQQPRTLMAWVRVPTGESSENQTLFGYGNNANGQRFSFRLNGSSDSSSPGTPQQPVRLEVQGGSIVGNTPVDDGQWHHIAIVCDDFNDNGNLQVEETRIYVDGVLDTDSTGGLPASSSAARNIDTATSMATLGGSNHSPGYSFFGEIDEFRLFSRALTHTEIEAFANATQQVPAAWHRQYFGGLPLTDWTLDLDNDNYNLLAEFAFGGNPRLPDSGRIAPNIAFDPQTGKLNLSFRRRSPASQHDLRYTVEASRNLRDWTTLTTTEVSSTSLSPSKCLEEAVFETTASSLAEPKQFTRVKAEFEP